MVKVSTAYATHLIDMYVDKHTGKHMTGDRVRILLLSLPFLLWDLIAPEVHPRASSRSIPSHRDETVMRECTVMREWNVIMPYGGGSACLFDPY